MLWEKEKMLVTSLNSTLYRTIWGFHNLRQEGFEHVGKGKNAGNQHFLLFPQCFVTYHRKKKSFWHHLICHQFGHEKNVSFGKGLTLSQRSFNVSSVKLFRKLRRKGASHFSFSHSVF